MKKLNFLLSLGLGINILLTSCQPKVDIEKEKTAIIKVLNEEGEVFIANDMKRLSALHVQDELDTRLEVTKIYSGWSEIEKLYQSYNVNKLLLYIIYSG